ncbi:hypothetical protein ACFFRR_010369 [Megaselia abdita]
MGYFDVLVFLIAISVASGSSVLQYFIGHADCTGVPYGWLVRNPLDCGSYFICEDEIQYERCPSLLHFDAEKRVCNWPDKAKCDWTVLPPITFPDATTSNPVPTKHTPTTTTTKPTTVRPSTTTRRIEATTKATTTTVKTTTSPRTTTTIKSTTTTTQKPKPTTTTTQKPKPKPTTEKPHPPTTENSKVTTEDIFYMKWVCENVILKETVVGEVESEMGAYDKEAGKRVDPMNTFNPKKVSCLYDGVYFLPHPTACDNYYICSHRSLIAHSCGNGVSWNFQTNQCDISLKAKCYKKEINPEPHAKTTTATTEKVTKYVTPEKPKTTLNEKLPVCPMNVQTYYSHPEDCRKYYICIAGLPVLTTCPDELYWNDKHKFCGLPQYTECNVKKA